MSNEIWLLPFFGQGHLFPTMELCKRIASRDFKTILLIPSNLSSSIPSSLLENPLVQITEIPSASPSPPPDHHPHHHNHMSTAIENILSTRPEKPDCVVLDVMMSWAAEIFKKFGVPTVAFFTSGACSAAMEYAIWTAQPLDIKPGQVHLLPGLPEEMALTYSDMKQRPHGPPPGPPGSGSGFPPPGQPGPGMGFSPPGPPGSGSPTPGAPGPGMGFSPPRPPPGGPGSRKMGPPKMGGPPPWVEEVEGSMAMIFNTCEDLERPFIEYISNHKGIPVWGVGPLLPEQYWKSAGSILHDREFRTNRRSNVTEDEVIQWLDSKAHGSVLYIAFGTEVGPTTEEYAQLAEALEESTRPFIWVIQPGSGGRGPPPGQPGPPPGQPGPPPGQPGPPPGQPGGDEGGGYFPHGLESRVGARGLIISGWAPQLLILSHPSTGGFLSHCGWNSTVEAIGRGVPFLVWPIRGDQHYDAMLVVKYLKVGYMVSEDLSKKIDKEEIVRGIEQLMSDEDIKRRAVARGAIFQHGFPAASTAALDTFTNLIGQKPV